LYHDPLHLIYSPTDGDGALPVTATKSLCDLTLTRKTQKPFSELWKVIRSIVPERYSLRAVVAVDDVCGATVDVIGIGMAASGLDSDELINLLFCLQFIISVTYRPLLLHLYTIIACWDILP